MCFLYFFSCYSLVFCSSPLAHFVRRCVVFEKHMKDGNRCVTAQPRSLQHIRLSLSCALHIYFYSAPHVRIACVCARSLRCRHRPWQSNSLASIRQCVLSTHTELLLPSARCNISKFFSFIFYVRWTFEIFGECVCCIFCALLFARPIRLCFFCFVFHSVVWKRISMVTNGRENYTC